MFKGSWKEALTQTIREKFNRSFDGLLKFARNVFCHNHSQQKITLFIFIVALILVSQFYVWVSADLEEARIPEVDLAGRWEVCLPDNPSPSNCRWREVDVPHELGSSLRPELHGWMVYRKSFVTPDSCLGKNSACALFIGEVGDTAEASLNGVTMGRRGDFPPNEVYSKHYPVRFDLSRDLLREGENQLLLTVYSLKKVQAGIRRGPVGIYSGVDAFKTTQSIIASTIFIPVLSFVGLFAIAIVASLMSFSHQSEDAKAHS